MDVEQEHQEAMVTNLDHVSDEELLEGYSYLLENVKLWRSRLGRQEMEIRHRMEAREATAIPSDAFRCEDTTKVVYDHTRFAPLKHLLTAEDLASCLVPAHDEIVAVPDKWSTVRVKSTAKKYGSEALKVVEAAVTFAPGPLKFEAKERLPDHPEAGWEPEAKLPGVDLVTGEIIGEGS